MFVNIRGKIAFCLLGILCVSCMAIAEPFSGVVLRSDERSGLLVQPDDAARYGAEVKVDVCSGDARIGYVDQHVRGSLLEGAEGWYLDSIWPDYGKNEAEVRRINEQLHLRIGSKKIGDGINKGDPMPDFVLLNHRGELVRSRDFREKTVVMTFIFSRCAAPTMCPANVARMMRMHREVKAQGLQNVQFVLMSFDPEYDTPGVLNDYAKAHRLDPEDFMLLTGEKQVIDDLMKEFGVFVVPASGTLSHTSVAVVVDRNGILAHKKSGFRWNVRDFVDHVKILND